MECLPHARLPCAGLFDYIKPTKAEKSRVEDKLVDQPKGKACVKESLEILKVFFIIYSRLKAK